MTKQTDNFFSTDIVVLNDEERTLVRRFLKLLEGVGESSILEIGKKLTDLERMSDAISRFPSMKEKTFFAGEKRSWQTLIEHLCSTNPDARMLSMPTKAILGRGFLVAKFQIFSAMTKIAINSSFEKSEIENIRTATLNIMFTLMAEDVYISILDSNLLNKNAREEIAVALVYLWEHRLDQNTLKFAPTLTNVWFERNKLAPVFGTMMGTSELFLLSSKLGDSWSQFTTQKLSNKIICQSLEEFLFGLSYEDILAVKSELKKQKQTATNKEQVFKFLQKDTELDDNDPKLFYSSYVKRRNDANARKRLSIEGPKNTLEDYYISFLFENKIASKEEQPDYTT